MQKEDRSYVFVLITFFLLLVLGFIAFELYRKNSKKIANELRMKNYISDNLRKGFKPKKIKGELLKEGYSRGEIDKEFPKHTKSKKLGAFKK